MIPPDTVTAEGYEYEAKVNDQDVAQDDGTRAFIRDVLLIYKHLVDQY